MDTQSLYKRTKHIWKNDEDSYLGFLCVNFFKSTNGNCDLDNILEAKLLSNKYDKTISEIENSPLKYEGYTQFGPLDINNIEKSDFKKINFFQLSKEVQRFWENDTHGADWPIFQRHWKYLSEQLSGLISKECELYYINSDNVRKELIQEENFFTYFIGGICIEENSNVVVIFYLGGD